MNTNVYVSVNNSKGLEDAISYLERKKAIRKKELNYLNITKVKEYTPRATIEEKESFVIPINFNTGSKPLILNGSGSLHHLTYIFLQNLPLGSQYSILFLDKHGDGSPLEHNYYNYKLDYYHYKTDNYYHYKLNNHNYNKNIWYGSFVIDIIADNQHVKNLVWLDYDNSRLVEVLKKDVDEVKAGTFNLKNQEEICSSLHELLIDNVYISLDLDCLSYKDISTDFNQGNMKLSLLLEILNNISEKHNIVGADICGLNRYGVYGNSLRTYSKIFNMLTNALKGN